MTTSFRTTSRAFLGTLLLMLSGGALASTATDPNDGHVRLDPSSFSVQRDRIERELHGEKYFEISRGDKRRVEEALSRMEHRLAGVDDVAQLDSEARLAVFNDQELVNQLLTRAAADSRMDCRREKKIGSHMPVNVCMTVAQRRLARDHAQDAARRATLYLEVETE